MESSEKITFQVEHIIIIIIIKFKKKIKSVAYSSQGSQTGQLDSCNWLVDGNTTG